MPTPNPIVHQADKKGGCEHDRSIIYLRQRWVRIRRKAVADFSEFIGSGGGMLTRL